MRNILELPLSEKLSNQSIVQRQRWNTLPRYWSAAAVICALMFLWSCSDETGPADISRPPASTSNAHSYESTVAHLRSSDPAQRAAAATALLRHADRIDDVIAELRPLTRDPNVAVRVTAIESLGRIMGRAKEALPDILDALGDDAIEVRVTAAASLIAIDPEQIELALPSLAEGLQVESGAVRIATLRTLSGLGVASDAIITEIENLLWDPSDEVRAAAKTALERFRDAG